MGTFNREYIILFSIGSQLYHYIDVIYRVKTRTKRTQQLAAINYDVIICENAVNINLLTYRAWFAYMFKCKLIHPFFCASFKYDAIKGAKRLSVLLAHKAHCENRPRASLSGDSFTSLWAWTVYLRHFTTTLSLVSEDHILGSHLRYDVIVTCQ